MFLFQVIFIFLFNLNNENALQKYNKYWIFINTLH